MNQDPKFERHDINTISYITGLRKKGEKFYKGQEGT